LLCWTVVEPLELQFYQDFCMHCFQNCIGYRSQPGAVLATSACNHHCSLRFRTIHDAKKLVLARVCFLCLVESTLLSVELACAILTQRTVILVALLDITFAHCITSTTALPLPAIAIACGWLCNHRHRAITLVHAPQVEEHH
jgi:hypothetical protein